MISFKYRPQTHAFLEAVVVTRERCAGVPICADDALIPIHGEEHGGASPIGRSDSDDPLSTEPFAERTLFNCPRRGLGKRAS